MKITYCLILLSVTACATKDTTSLPSFKSNGSLDNIWSPIRDIVVQKDYSIVYSEGGGSLVEQGSLTHKIFCFSNEVWQKIEIKNGKQETDTLNGYIQLIEKNITLKKDCTQEDSQTFLNNLISLGLFELSTEKELIAKCEEKGEHITLTHDADWTTFYLVHGKNVRILTFYDLEQKKEDCPSVSEMDQIIKIKEFFKENWFSKRH